MKDPSLHYDDAYFSWYLPMGLFGAKFKVRSFQPYIAETDRVVDFGCGGGHLLANLSCAERLGVEINPKARKEAKQLGIQTVKEVLELEDDWCSVPRYSAWISIGDTRRGTRWPKSMPSGILPSKAILQEPSYQRFPLVSRYARVTRST
jgi:SAM-dependent methyltransferase